MAGLLGSMVAMLNSCVRVSTTGPAKTCNRALIESSGALRKNKLKIQLRHVLDVFRDQISLERLVRICIVHAYMVCKRACLHVSEVRIFSSKGTLQYVARHEKSCLTLNQLTGITVS